MGIEGERVGPTSMSRNHRNNFKRQYVRLKGWLTLGNVGITPRLVIAFAAVAALAAAANLIVENGVSILEQQHNAELERSTHDSQAITTLRESVGRAEKLVTSAKLSVAVGVFDRAVHEHVEADSRSLGRALFERTRFTGPGAESVCARYAGVEPIVDACRQCASQNRRRTGAGDAQAPRALAAIFGGGRRASTRASRNPAKVPGRFSATCSHGSRCWIFTPG